MRCKCNIDAKCKCQYQLGLLYDEAEVHVLMGIENCGGKVQIKNQQHQFNLSANSARLLQKLDD